MSVFIASNLFCGGPTSAECFVSNPVLSKLTSFSRQEVHRRLRQILGRAEKSLMPRKRVAMVEVVVVAVAGNLRGNNGKVAVFAVRCHQEPPLPPPPSWNRGRARGGGGDSPPAPCHGSISFGYPTTSKPKPPKQSCPPTHVIAPLLHSIKHQVFGSVQGESTHL